MKKLGIVLLLLILLLLGAGIYFFIVKDALNPDGTGTASAAPSESAQATTTPDETTDIRLAFCGDVVCHIGLNEEAKQPDGTYDYTPIFGSASEILSQADYASCTMETTFPDTTQYSGFPQFKSPPALAAGLKSIGVDLVNTASNHCMDSYESGLKRTLDVLDEDGLDHVGTYRTQAEHDDNNGILVKDVNGVKIAYLSFTYGTNGIPVTGCEYVTNIFFNDYLTTLNDINYDFIDRDMAAARALDADLIVVMMHWGTEYFTQPVDYQKELADHLFSQGADLVIGGHCHVPEPIELRRVTDDKGNEKTGLLAYCLGNFVSCQNDRYTNLTAILNVDIQKDKTTGKTTLKNVSYVPMLMADLNDYGISGSWRYRLLNLEETIAGYKNGYGLDMINSKMYAALTQGLDDIHGIMGAEFDCSAGGVDVGKWEAGASGDQKSSGKAIKAIRADRRP